MYIGNRDVRGLHHLVTEVVDNSIDEVMAGFAKMIQVTVNRDGSITVADDGRGIPVDTDPSIGRSALEGVMTMLKYGGKFGKTAYKTSGGLHGMGVKAVNFLSEWCEVEVRRGGHVYQQEYERGKPTGPVVRVGIAHGTGTKTTFKPDYQVFGDLKFDYNILYKRLQELAFLNRGVKIVFRDARSGVGETFQYEDGLIEFVRYLNRASEAVHPDIVYVNDKSNEAGVEIEIAFQYCGEYTENVHCYANNINTIDGGTHLTGFRTALTRTLNAYGKKENIFKDIVPGGEDLREGLTAIISVRLPEPQFEAQTKGKLNNPEVEGIVNSVVGRLPGEVSRRAPEDRPGDRLQGGAGRRGPRGRPQSQGPAAGAQRGPQRRRTARQTPRLHQPRRRSLRTLPRRRRFRRRQRRGRAHPPVPGHPPLARQDHQRLQVPRRQGAGQRGSPQHHLRRRLRHRRRGRPDQAPLRQDHHHDRRRR